MDCIVVGGGLIGLLTARELAAAGLKTAVLERGVPGREASWAGGGILSPLYPWRAPPAVTALARWSQAQYPQLAQALAAESGIDPQWTPSGLLVLNGGEAGMARAWAGEQGVAMECLDAVALRECEPGLAVTDDAVGLWFPEVAQIRNPALLRALRLGLERQGVEVRGHVAVRRIRRGGGRVEGVETDAGFVAAQRVIVAGGAWSGELLDPLGVPVPVHPVRGQMILFGARPGLVRHMVLHRDRYAIPRRDGRILAGSTLEESGFDKSTTVAARDALHAAALRMFPALGDFPIECHWAGLRPASPDGIPFIGPHPAVRGLYVNTGHYRNGVVMGPASARLLADMVLWRAPVVDAAPYAILPPPSPV